MEALARSPAEQFARSRLGAGLPTHAISTPGGNRQLDWTVPKDPQDPANDRKGELSAILLHELARFRAKDLDPFDLGEIRDRQRFIYHGVATITDTGGHTARAELEITIDPPVEPVLTLTLTDTALELCWPLESADLRLVAAYELDADSWFPVETDILSEGDSFLVHPSLEDEALFYRLVQ